MKSKFLLPTLFMLAIVSLSSQCEKESVSPEKAQLGELEISLDQTAWFCISNCGYNFSFQEGSVLTRRFDAPNDDTPLWECKRILPDSDWNAILSVIDLDALSQTAETIGCPGCADEPIETLRVTNGDFTREIRMNVMEEVPAIQALLDELRSQADQYKNQEDCQ